MKPMKTSVVCTSKTNKDKSKLAFGLFSIFVLILIWAFLPVLSRAERSKAYRLGPDDVLNLTIYAGGEKQFDENLTVSELGTIAAPFIGDMRVEGLTTTELEDKLKIPLERDFFVDPRVDVHIVGYHSLHYYISGAVQTPGLYEVPKQITLIELIAKAGGVLADRGNLAYIMRNSSARDVKDVEAGKVKELLSKAKPIRVDLKKLLDDGDMSANVFLKGGDMVYIPLMKSLDMGLSQIYVEGEVENPGAYEFRPGMTAMNACIMAGGFSTFAAPNRTKIIRKTAGKTEVIKIDLNDVRDGDIPDIELQPGDRIHVPETWL